MTLVKTTGKYKGYYWLQSQQLGQLDVLEHAGGYFVDKYLAITSFDSGPLILSAGEIREGWTSDAGIAYSPGLTKAMVGSIPSGGFDEWYFLDNRKLTQVSTIYVNFAPFEITGNSAPEGFWQQIEEINPYAYVADGTLLTIISRDKALIDLFNDLQ